ncbi:MAG: hypothetical protein OXG33_06435 [Chloroflexi bacterium]|nr:hypothetical protein [Chloroflexota bacterium]
MPRIPPRPIPARGLLLVAVAFLWGLILVPRLFSIAFPEWLPVDVIRQLQLDPEQEGSLANAASAFTFAVAAILALANAVGSWRTASGGVVVGSWVAPAVVLGLLAWNEIADAHSTDLPVFGAHLDQSPWALSLLSLPLIIALALGAWAFARKALPPESRRTFALGAAAVLAAIVIDGLHGPLLIRYRAPGLASITEETLEVSGALLIACSAAIAMRHRAAGARRSGGIRCRRLAAGAVAAVIVLGSLAFAFVFRVPIVNAHPPANVGKFELSLKRHESIVQGLHMPATPIGRIDLRVAVRDGLGDVGIRVFKIADGPARLLSHGSAKTPPADWPGRVSVDLFPPVAEPAGQRLALEVVGDVGPDAELRMAMTRGDNRTDGRLQINGALAWPDTALDFVAYTAPEPTRSKLAALWWLVTSDWRWPALFAVLAVGLTLVTLTPAVLLVASAYAAGAPWGRRKHRRRPNPALRRA